MCQPQLEEKGRLYCEEHGLYEDECSLCHPELKNDSEGEKAPKTKKSSKLDVPTRTAPGLFCREHEVPEAECGICQPQRTAELERQKREVLVNDYLGKAQAALSNGDIDALMQETRQRIASAFPGASD